MTSSFYYSQKVHILKPETNLPDRGRNNGFSLRRSPQVKHKEQTVPKAGQGSRWAFKKDRDGFALYEAKQSLSQEREENQMKKLLKKTTRNQAFTLAELLIVVAIIAVLVAIAIPVFNTQLERSREATDVANIRSAYADAMSKYLVSTAAEQKTGVSSDMTVEIKQRDANWSNTDIDWSFWGTTAPTIRVGTTYSVTLKGNGSDNPVASLAKPKQ